MKKYMIGYCCKCFAYTKQEVIECEDSFALRAAETVLTFGFGALFSRRYQCECTKRGHINSILKGKI